MSGIVARADVVVIGAGFCGLSAAQALVEAGQDVVVLEARHRVGGRVDSRLNTLGERIDVGGQFLCDDMPEVMKLARERGKTLRESSVSGDFIVQPSLPDDESDRVYARSTAMRERMKLIDPRDPGIAGLSVAAWLDRQGDDPASKAVFRSMIEGLWCIAIERLPLWYLISNDRRITNEVRELQYFVAETMHALADDLARDLGSRLRLTTPAISISHGSEGVRVDTETGSIKARAVIVAVPPVMASKIAYTPALPTTLSNALRAWENGAVVKALIRYARPFWRDSGHSGMIAWREPPSLFAFDCSPDDDHATLVFFAGGPSALAMRAFGEQRMRAELLSRLSSALGPHAATPEDVTLVDWTHDRWSGGAYSDLIVDTAATDAEDVLRRGLQGLVFASSELSPSFPGYVEGAIIAGRLAAARSMADLGAAQSSSS